MDVARATAAQKRLDELALAHPSESPLGHFLASATIVNYLDVTADIFSHTEDYADVQTHLAAERELFVPWVRSLELAFTTWVSDHLRSDREMGNRLKASARVYAEFLTARRKEVGTLVVARHVSQAKDLVVRVLVAHLFLPA